MHAAVILRNLSVNSESEVKIVQEGSLPPLINLLRSNDVEVQVASRPNQAHSARLTQCTSLPCARRRPPLVHVLGQPLVTFLTTPGASAA